MSRQAARWTFFCTAVNEFLVGMYRRVRLLSSRAMSEYLDHFELKVNSCPKIAVPQNS